MLRRAVNFGRSHWVGRYITLSAVSFALNLLITVLLHEIVGVSEELAFLGALLIVFITNFLGLRYYVYVDSSTSLISQFAGYAFSSIGFRTSEYLAFLVAHTWIGAPYHFSAGLILVLSYALKQLVHRSLVFPKSEIDKTIGRDCSN